MPQTTETTGPRAVQLLDQVYDALLEGAYAALPAMAEQLEHELQTASLTLTEAQLQVIRRKAERNGACLLSAQRGGQGGAAPAGRDQIHGHRTCDL